MTFKLAAAFLIACFCGAAFALAQEAAAPPPDAPTEATPGGASSEVKKTQPLKPRPDSVISVVMQLPVVRKWGEWIASKNDGSSLVVWGESLKTVNGSLCWGVAVGEDGKDGVRVWRRFCAQKTGLEIFVESIPSHEGDEITYTPYDEWQRECEPTPSSTGKC